MSRTYDVEVESGGAFAGLDVVLRAMRVFGVALAVVLGLCGLLSGAFLLGLLSLGVCGLAIGLLGMIAQKLATRVRPARVSVDGETLVLDHGVASGKGGTPRTLRRRSLRSARVIRRHVGHEVSRVVLERSFGRQTSLVMGSHDEARALLRELGLSPRERPMTFRFFFGLVITVGADGVLFRWPLLGRRRFVPYAKILAVRDHAPGSYVLRFELANGQHYEVGTITLARHRTVAEHHALVERIDDACASYRAAESGGPAALLARNGRSAAGWIRDLRTLHEAGGSGYRVAMLPSTTLWDLALDPGADPDLRVGASLALRAALDAEGRRKLQAAAEASASPRVRVVLDATAAELDDESLGAVLDDVAPLRSRRA